MMYSEYCPNSTYCTYLLAEAQTQIRNNTEKAVDDDRRFCAPVARWNQSARLLMCITASLITAPFLTEPILPLCLSLFPFVAQHPPYRLVVYHKRALLLPPIASIINARSAHNGRQPNCRHFIQS